MGSGRRPAGGLAIALIGLLLVPLALWRARRRPTDLALWGLLAGLALDGLGRLALVERELERIAHSIAETGRQEMLEWLATPLKDLPRGRHPDLLKLFFADVERHKTEIVFAQNPQNSVFFHHPINQHEFSRL